MVKEGTNMGLFNTLSRLSDSLLKTSVENRVASSGSRLPEIGMFQRMAPATPELPERKAKTGCLIKKAEDGPDHEDPSHPSTKQ